MKKLLVILMVVAMASFLFVGCMPGVTPEPDPTPDPTPTPNQAPGITSTAITSGKVGVAYTYDVNATDPDGDTLTYSLTAAPAKMTIVATTGVISWKPTAAGVFEVAVKVSDTKLSDTQSFEITVAAADVTPPTIPTTVAPIIIAQDAGALVNKAEAANGIIVNGTGRTYAEIKLFIGGVLVSSGDVKIDGTWIVVIAKAELGKDGAKTLYATATETGYKESKKSNEVKFTLDTVAPGIAEVKATANAAATTTGGTAVTTTPSSGTVITTALTVTAANVEAGVWLLDMVTGVNLQITDPNGIQVTYAAIPVSTVFLAGVPIPGVSFTLKSGTGIGAFTTLGNVAFTSNVGADTISDVSAGFTVLAAGDVIIVTGSPNNNGAYTLGLASTTSLITLIPTDTLTTEVATAGVVTITPSPLAVGQHNRITCTAQTVTAAIGARATLKFNEAVSYTGAMAGTYGGLVAVDPQVYKEANDTCYWTSGLGAVAVYSTQTITVYGVADKAGNVGGTVTSPLSASCTVGIASATSLAPQNQNWIEKTNKKGSHP